MAEVRGLQNLLVTESRRTVWLWLSTLPAKTSRILVGTGITNLYLRHPLLVALPVMTIDQVAPGRRQLGLGFSTGCFSMFLLPQTQ